jgi:ABC-type multidrug transport system fused ATPase/permease subunit
MIKKTTVYRNQSIVKILIYAKPYWKTLTLSLISASIYGLVAAAPTWVIKNTIDDVLIKKYQGLIIPFLLLFVGFFVLKIFLCI